LLDELTLMIFVPAEVDQGVSEISHGEEVVHHIVIDRHPCIAEALAEESYSVVVGLLVVVVVRNERLASPRQAFRTFSTAEMAETAMSRPIAASASDRGMLNFGWVRMVSRALRKNSRSAPAAWICWFSSDGSTFAIQPTSGFNRVLRFRFGG
jgi:hypothetical protein